MSESKIYSTKQKPDLLVEILEQDRFTALLHRIHCDDPEAKEYILATKLTKNDDVVDWRRAVQYDSLEQARERRDRLDKTFRIDYYEDVLETCKGCVNASYYDTFRYDLNAAYNAVIEQIEPIDVETAAALYIRSKAWDGRITKDNITWAEDYLSNKKDKDITSDEFGSDFAHPVIANDFIRIIRKEADERQKEKKQVTEIEEDIKPITIIVSGERNNLNRLKDYALSLGASVEDFDPFMTVNINTYSNHADELENAANELNLNCLVETDPTERLHRLINEWCAQEYGDDDGADMSNPSRVPIAFTTDPDTELPIRIYANLDNLSIITEYAGVPVRTTYYENERDMGDVFLNLEFDEITALTDEEKSQIDLMPKLDSVRIIEDEQIEGLTFYMYDDGSGKAVYNSVDIGHVDYATNEYDIGGRGWDVLSTGAPDDDIVDFKEQCRKYVEQKFNDVIYRSKGSDKTRK